MDPRVFGWQAKTVVAAVLVSSLALATDSDPKTEPDPLHRGANLLYHLDAVTVVFAAGSGEDVAVNRASAEIRARLLERRNQVRTVVIADDAVSPETLRGHLFVLGWRNRVLGTPQAPLPFSREPDGLTFLGVTEGDPSADLLFAAPSPYNPDKYLVFWSRVDPEMDRFQTLPRVGSDWAIYRGLQVVQQGMFLPGSAWPPALNPKAQTDHGPELLEAESSDRTLRSDHYDVVATKAVPPAELAEVLRAREAAYSEAVARFGAPPAGFRIRLLVYKDDAEKKTRTGVEDPVHSIPRRREIHMVLRYAKSPSPHEEIHLVVRPTWGPCYLTALYEGLAVSAEGVFRGKDLALHAAILLQRGAPPTVADLLDEVGVRLRPSEEVWPAYGLLTSWLKEVARPEVFKKIYGMREGRIEELARLLGRTPSEVEAQFRSWLDLRAASRASELAFRQAQAEAQERLAVADYPGMVKALERALTIRPDDPQTLFNIAAAQLRSGEYGNAEQRLRRILALPLAEADQSLRPFAHYQLGRLYDVTGRRENAVSEYRKVLELPDVKDVHRLAREAIETPVTREQLE